MEAFPQVVALLLQAVAGLLGLGLARRRAAYLPLAHPLLLLFVLSSARWASTWPARGLKPYMGWGRRWWALEQGTTTTFYVTLALAVGWALWDRKPRAKTQVGGVGVALGASFFVGVFTGAAWAAYPIIRGPRLPPVLTAIVVLSAAAQITALFLFVNRVPRPVLTVEALTAGALAISSVLSAAGPFLFARPDRDWAIAPWIAIGTLLVIVALQLSALRRAEGAPHG